MVALLLLSGTIIQIFYSATFTVKSNFLLVYIIFQLVYGSPRTEKVSQCPSQKNCTWEALNMISWLGFLIASVGSMKLISLQLLLSLCSPICPFFPNFHLVAHQSCIYECKESVLKSVFLHFLPPLWVRQYTRAERKKSSFQLTDHQLESFS